MKTRAIAMVAPGGEFTMIDVDIREPTAEDLTLDVLCGGVCHTDIHYADDDWNNTNYPAVPGHEIVGRVTAVGQNVKGFKVGDIVGAGYIVDSCHACTECTEGLENYCDKAVPIIGKATMINGTTTTGGWAKQCVVDHRFAIRVPADADFEAVAPLLCAGLTVYSPMELYGMQKGGLDVGVVGLGGLGHIAVMMLKAMGNRVYVFDPVESKRELADKVGATKFFTTRDLAQCNTPLDFILDVAPGQKPLDPYLKMLKSTGTLVLIGLGKDAVMLTVDPANLVFKGRRLAGSLTGSVACAERCIEFCNKHKISPWIESIKPHQINEGIRKLNKGEVKFRLVVDFTGEM